MAVNILLHDCKSRASHTWSTQNKEDGSKEKGI